MSVQKGQRVRQTPHRPPFAEKVTRDGTVVEDVDQFGWPLVRFDDDPDVVAANPNYLEKIDPAWSVWMLFPGEAGGGWSRIAGGLTQADAEKFAAALLFQGRAMPDLSEGL